MPVQMRTILEVADNSGAKKLSCILPLGGSTGLKAELGDIITASVKEAAPDSAVKKGSVVKCVIVRTRKEPPDKGGWNLLFTWWLAADVINPAVHFGLSGAGPRAWFGWPDVPQLEKLITDWVRAGDETKRKQLASEVQKVALSEVTYVPWGEWFQPTAFRKNVRDVLKFGAPIFWNVKVT